MISPFSFLLAAWLQYKILLQIGSVEVTVFVARGFNPRLLNMDGIN